MHHDIGALHAFAEQPYIQHITPDDMYMGVIGQPAARKRIPVKIIIYDNPVLFYIIFN